MYLIFFLSNCTKICCLPLYTSFCLSPAFTPPQMKLPIYQVDAFTNQPFKGNPAAVIPLESWLAPELMQHIAAENNLAETAFFVREGQDYHIRWFTPSIEVDLCGHATLAAAFVLYQLMGYRQASIRFTSRSGNLIVSPKDDLYCLDFPVSSLEPAGLPSGIVLGLGSILPDEVWKAPDDLMVVVQHQTQVAQIKPDFSVLKRIKARGIIVTAPGEDCDFVSRFFAPQSGIDEDPVTGSAHTKLIPYWAQRMGKKILTARQLSARGGWLWCELSGERVFISGHACLYLTGEILLSDYSLGF
jgi:PhzF family phenazine biosynthesis protein